MMTPSLRKAVKEIIASGIVLGVKRHEKYMWRGNRKA
jgi:hypothetical protein